MHVAGGLLVKEFGSNSVLEVMHQEKLDGDATRRVLWYLMGWPWAHS